MPPDVAVANSFLQQCAAVTESNQQLQLRKPRHPKRPQLSSRESGLLTKRKAHSVIYKQNRSNYNESVFNYEKFLDLLMYNQINKFDRNASNLADIAIHISTPQTCFNKYKCLI